VADAHPLEREKTQIRRTKSQISNKSQIQKSNDRNGPVLNMSSCVLEFVWDFGFGIFGLFPLLDTRSPKARRLPQPGKWRIT
jgi:hypothetical protein